MAVSVFGFLVTSMSQVHFSVWYRSVLTIPAIHHLIMQPSSSGGLGGLISKGLGRFGLGGMMKLGGGGNGSGGGGSGGDTPGGRHPGQSDLVLVFVVGGIGLDEARQVHAEVAEKSAAVVGGGGPGGSGPRVLLGGTALVSPLDVCRQLIRLG